MTISLPRLAMPWNLITACSLIFLTMMIFVHVPTAAASCSSVQNDANVTYLGTSAGGIAYEDLPILPVLCAGGWSNGGEVHGSVGQSFNSQCGGEYKAMEAGIFYGQLGPGGASSGSNLNYFYNVWNSCSIGQVEYDVSAGDGLDPSQGDNISVWIGVNAAGNYYQVQFQDYSASYTITISNVATPARTGPASLGELESWNPSNVVDVYWGTLMYESTSYSFIHYPTNAGTSSTSSSYAWSQPNSYYDDWCAYYTSYVNYCP
jgi:hypothetical protein